MNNVQRLQVFRRIVATGSSLFFAAGVSLTLSGPASAAEDMKGMDHSDMPGMKQSPGKGTEQGKTPDTGQDSMKGMDHTDMPGMNQDSMKGMKHEGMEGMQKPDDKGSMESMGDMQMGPMQGGRPPPDARDPNANADGLTHGPMVGMDMADDALFGYVLLDKFEYARERTFRLDGQAWYGGDRNKLWLKADGERTEGKLGATRTEALWNRSFATYWGSQLGIRHDFADGPGRNWAALGVQGLAPYWFDVQATAYVGQSGRTAARVEFDYDQLITQRLVLQPNIELNVYGKNDPSRNIGSGLSDIEAGLRLRYEIKRQFAPYIGVSWRRKFGNTARFSRSAGEDVNDTKFVAGIRIWF